jgi:hypothetical protein
MSIQLVNEDFEDRSGEWTVSEGRNYVRKFIVQMSSQGDGPNLAIQAVGINRGDQYTPYFGLPNEFEWDLNAYCNKISATMRGVLVWIVTVEYGPYSSLFAGGGPTQNPILMPIDASWSNTSHDMVADIDVNGVPILNTAGDPYDPSLMEEEKRPTLTIVRNELSYDPTIDQSYNNAVNSDIFAGYPPLYSRVLEIVPKSLFHQDVGWYYQRTYMFEFKNPTLPVNANGYRRTIISQGMNAISTVSGVKYRINHKGIPTGNPECLTKSGGEAVGSLPAYWQVWQTKPELPFAVFNFDQTVLIGQRTGFNYNFGNQGA